MEFKLEYILKGNISNKKSTHLNKGINGNINFYI